MIGEKSKLEGLIIRCYELASNAGNGEASFQLCLLYGGAANLNGAEFLIPYSGAVFKCDDVLSSKYLGRAIDQKDTKALLLRDLKKELRERQEDKMIKDNIEELNKPSSPFSEKCSKCNGTGHTLKKKVAGGRLVPVREYASDNECPYCKGTGKKWGGWIGCEKVH